MRKLLTLSILLFTIISLHSQVLTGADAARLFPNADEVRMDERGTKAVYIHFNAASNFQIENLSFWATNYLGFKETSSLVLLGIETDGLGMLHYRYQQYYKGKPVQYSMLIVHTLKSRVVSMNGEIFTKIQDSFEPNLTENDALKKALLHSNADVYAWQDMLHESIIKSINDNASSSYYPTGTLVYVTKNNSTSDADFRLAYRFNIYASKPLSRTNIFVDASDGSILFAEDQIHTANVTGTAHTKYSGIRQFTTDSTAPGNYRLRETGRGLGIETYNMKNGTSAGASVDFVDSNNVWNNVNALKDEVATDAHWGAEQTYDYFFNMHNRNSINGSGFKLRSYVHYSNNYNNAFWNGQYMTYGDGNGTTFTPLTALDVCGHEISHGLTSNTANLVYSNESGALNESFSDVFGTTIEAYGRGGVVNWKIGEDMTPGAGGIRNMQNPKLFTDPNTYLKQYWVPAGGTDNGGVHTNSGVQNYWYYLMCQGGSGTNDNGKAYTVPGMGMVKAGKIAFRTLTTYLTPNSKYADARFYSILSTKDLYGQCGPEVKITTNTWSAVGVGNDFDSTIKALFYSNDTLICGSSGNAAFFSTSNFAATYLWDFGDGQTSTLANPTHFYASTGNYNVKLKVGSCATPVKYDSTTKVAYIKVTTTNPLCLAQRMPAGSLTGSTITLCAGKLLDDGGNSNYSHQTNSVRTIAPTNAGFLKLKFNAFNFENGYDYLYIYDGPSITSPLIGKFTGASLPNGGNITTTQGTVTFRQSTDPAVNAIGFDVDWQCFIKSSNDISIVKILPIKSLRQNTPTYTSNSTVAVVVKNVGTVAQNNIPVNYKVNGGAPVTGIYTDLLLPNDFDTMYFNTPITNTVGNFTVKAYSTLSNDTIRANDTAYTIFKIVENAPVVLPFVESFEGMGVDSSNTPVFSLTGAGKIDYDNNDTFNLCRYRSKAQSITARTGNRAITFDRTLNITDVFSNFLTLTLNLTNYISQNKVYFEFYYVSHGDEMQDNDKVWVRGNMNDSWIEVFTLIKNDAEPTGIYFYVPNLRLDSILKANGQALSTNTQIRWGQQDNRSADNNTSSDGMSFDDIKVYAIATTGIKNNALLNDNLLIYPNPAKNKVFVKGIEGNLILTLTDATGKEVIRKDANADTELNTSELAAGIYLLHVSGEKFNTTRKLIID